MIIIWLSSQAFKLAIDSFDTVLARNINDFLLDLRYVDIFILIIRANLWNRLDAVKKFKETMISIDEYCYQDKNLLQKNGLLGEYKKLITINDMTQSRKKYAKLSSSSKTKGDIMVDSNTELNSPAHLLLKKEFPDL
jgi:hypothetical protein